MTAEPLDSLSMEPPPSDRKGSISYKHCNFFSSHRSSNFMMTQYGDQIKLIDHGNLPLRFRPRVIEILKKLSLEIADGKMSTFCITAFDCEVKIITLQTDERLKDILDKEKTYRARCLLIVRSKDGVKMTCYLLENGKQVHQNPIDTVPIMKNIREEISKLQDGVLAHGDAVNMFQLIEGLFTQESLSRIEYRVAVSGFSTAQESKTMQGKFNKLADFIPFSEKGTNHLLPSATVKTEPSDEPDSDKLTAFIRFLEEATTQADNIEHTEKAYAVSLAGNKKTIKNIQRLVQDKDFSKLLKAFSDIKSEALSPIELVVLFLYKYQAFDYQAYFDKIPGIQMRSYRIPSTCSASIREKIESIGWTEDAPEFEAYRIKSFSMQDFYPEIAQKIIEIANRYGINFDSLNELHQVFGSTSALALAAKSAHCSEDALLKYMQKHKEAFIAKGSSSFIFSVKITKALKDLESLDDICIEPRCDICRIHFDHDLSEILDIPTERCSMDAVIPKATNNNDMASVLAQYKKHGNSGMFFGIKTSTPGIFNVLKTKLSHDEEDTVYGGGDEFAETINTILQTQRLQKKHKTPLIRAAALGDIDSIKQLLEKSSINMNDQNTDDGNTALHYAAMIDDHNSRDTAATIVLELLNAGADPTVRNKNGKHVLDVFLESSDSDKLEGCFLEIHDLLREKCAGTPILK